MVLDGSNSFDPDGDSLTYTWSGPFPEGQESTTGKKPAVTLSHGTNLIVLSVDDGHGGTDMDEISVSIADPTPPEIALDLETIELWPPNGGMTNIASGITVTDI